tara:strand:+ start:14 stop:229 length:216 start_codon:yes stop_codon:yes gene_type:complete
MSKPKRMQSQSQIKKSQKKKKIRDEQKKKKALRKRARATEERQINAVTFKMEEEIRKIKNKDLTIRNDKVQ